VPNLRFPLAVSADYRSSDTSKDAIIENGFVEQESEQISYVVKRAGLIQKYVGTGIAIGIFVYSGKLYQWDSGNTATTPTVTTL